MQWGHKKKKKKHKKVILKKRTQRFYFLHDAFDKNHISCAFASKTAAVNASVERNVNRYTEQVKSILLIERI